MAGMVLAGRELRRALFRAQRGIIRGSDPRDVRGGAPAMIQRGVDVKLPVSTRSGPITNERIFVGAPAGTRLRLPLPQKPW